MHLYRSAIHDAEVTFTTTIISLLTTTLKQQYNEIHDKDALILHHRGGSLTRENAFSPTNDGVSSSSPRLPTILFNGENNTMLIRY
jgi:hypothetical protein